MTILDYMVVCKSDPDLLQEAVRARIDTGWQPLGGIGVRGGSQYSPRAFFQAMVLYGKSGKQVASKPLPEPRGSEAQGE